MPDGQLNLLQFKDLPKSFDLYDFLLERIKEKFPQYIITGRTISKSELYCVLGRFRFSRYMVRQICKEIAKRYPEVQFHSKGLRFLKNNGDEV